jgi:hypothetical protein
LFGYFKRRRRPAEESFLGRRLAKKIVDKQWKEMDNGGENGRIICIGLLDG